MIKRHDKCRCHKCLVENYDDFRNGDLEDRVWQDVSVVRVLGRSIKMRCNRCGYEYYSASHAALKEAEDHLRGQMGLLKDLAKFKVVVDSFIRLPNALPIQSLPPDVKYTFEAHEDPISFP